MKYYLKLMQSTDILRSILFFTKDDVNSALRAAGLLNFNFILQHLMTEYLHPRIW